MLFYERMRSFYKRYEHHINSVAFIAGFIFDFIAFKHVQHSILLSVLAGWLFFSAVAILLHSVMRSDVPRENFVGRVLDGIAAVIPFFIQFAFGAVMSGSLVFFSHSASPSVSWPFLAIIVGLAVGNEVFRGRYDGLVFQLVGFFVAAFLYFSLLFPIILHSVSGAVFVGSGVMSICVFYVLIRMLRRVARERYVQGIRFAWVGVILFFCVFNVLYFLNIIPPLPLALKEIGIYHKLTRLPNGDYELHYQPAGVFSFGAVSRVYNVAPGEGAYAFTAVYAPEGVRTTILHEWVRFDETGRRWVPVFTESFEMVGGRVDGFRGYTKKESLMPGKWRVNVLTISGRLIGRTTFHVEPVEGYVALNSLIR